MYVLFVLIISGLRPGFHCGEITVACIVPTTHDSSVAARVRLFCVPPAPSASLQHPPLPQPFPVRLMSCLRRYTIATCVAFNAGAVIRLRAMVISADWHLLTPKWRTQLTTECYHKLDFCLFGWLVGWLVLGVWFFAFFFFFFFVCSFVLGCCVVVVLFLFYFLPVKESLSSCISVFLVRFPFLQIYKHRRQLFSVRKTSRRHKNKDLSRLR